MPTASFDFANLALAFMPISAFCLAVGIHGIVAKRPFLLSSKWPLVMFLLLLAPIAAFGVKRVLEGVTFTSVLLLVEIAILVLVVGTRLRGYIIYGVTDETFEAAFAAARSARSLRCEETQVLGSPSTDADLHISASWSMGIAAMRATNRRGKRSLRAIAREMNEYFARTEEEDNAMTCAVNLFIGLASAAPWLLFHG